MKNLLLFLFTLTFSITKAQSVNDVLNSGIRIEKDQKIFVKFEKSGLKFALAKSLQDPANPPDFKTLKDTAVFLSNSTSTNVYLRPLNPLNYTYDTQVTIVLDPIYEDLKKQSSKFTLPSTAYTAVPAKPKTKSAPAVAAHQIECNGFIPIKNYFTSIESKLQNDQKDKILEQFSKLKELNFIDMDETKDKKELIRGKLKEVEDHYAEIDGLINEGTPIIEAYNCDNPSSETTKLLYTMYLTSIRTSLSEQRKELNNVMKIYQLIDDAYNSARTGGEVDGLRWSVILKELASEKGKNPITTIKINKGGYKLSTEKEIIPEKEELVTKSTFKLRRFQRFIPEISVGLAYTSIDYKKYTTTTDENGQAYVAAPTNENFKKINLATMINYIYYIPDSDVLPFYQLGIGLNSGIPTLLSGFGIRSNFDSVKRISISGGIAMTWVQELDKLKVGDPVTGSDQIENDLKYEFSWPPKLYVGIQYNF